MQSIERIESHVAGMSFDAFREDIKTIDAVERNFQKISEAAIRLGSQAERLCPGPPWPIFEALVTGSAINMTASILNDVAYGDGGSAAVEGRGCHGFATTG